MCKTSISVVKHVVYTASGYQGCSFQIEVGSTFVEDLTKEDLKEIRDAIDIAYNDAESTKKNNVEED